MAVVTEDLGRCSRLWLPLPAMLMNLIFSEGVAGDAGGDALGVAGDGAATGPSMEGARIAPDPSAPAKITPALAPKRETHSFRPRLSLPARRNDAFEDAPAARASRYATQTG